MFSPKLSAQTTIHVPADQPTIQAGIDAASPGDTVLISPGTYTENIDFKGKGITVTSGAKQYSEAAGTVITAANYGSVVSFITGEPPSAVLNGFTIRNLPPFPHSTLGNNGVAISNASPMITNNIIMNNPGCGVFVANLASPLIKGNDITMNVVDQSGTQDTCAGVSGYASVAGTGIGIDRAGTVSIINNIIERNSNQIGLGGFASPQYGGGIVIAGGHQTAIIQNNIIRNNIAQTVVSLLENTATADAKVIFTQNLVYGNVFSGSAAQLGTASSDIQFYGPYNLSATLLPTITETNNTIDAGQEFLGRFGPSTIENNLVIDTNKARQTALTCDNGAESSPLDIDNNDIYNGGLIQQRGCPLGTGNLGVDPLFLNESVGDFHTQRTSPIVAAGDPNAVPILATDLDGRNRTVCGTIDMGVYEVHPQPPIALTSMPNPSVGGSLVFLSGELTGNCNVPTGDLTFLDGAAPLGTVALDVQASASFSTANLTVGTHTLTAAYPGDFNFDPNTSNPVTQVVTGYPTVTTLQILPNPAVAFQAITFSATVSSYFGTLNGTVSFYAGTSLIASAPINAKGFASVTLSTLGAGNYNITALYNASVLFAMSSSPTVSLEVDGAPTLTALASAPNPSAYGQSVTFTATVTAPQSSGMPTGTVSFRDGTMLLGTAPLAPTGFASFSTASLLVGSHPITAQYSGSPNDNASVSSTDRQVVEPAGTTVTLTSSVNPANLGESITFVASVFAITSAPVPTGTILFTDQFGTLGTATLSSGKAILTTSSLAAGTHKIIATFISASGSYTISASSLSEIVQLFDFVISASSTSLTIPTSGYKVITVTLTPIGGFNHAVNLSCRSVPLYSQCVFEPPTSLGLVAGPQQLELVVNTDQIFEFGSKVADSSAHTRSLENGRIILFAVLIVPMMALRSHRGRGIKTLRPTLLPVVLLSALALLASLSGCSGKQPDSTAPGTYSFTVVASDAVPGTSITHSVDITLRVTPR